MRKLNRDSVDPPACLADYRHDEHKWDDLGARKAEIQICLEIMQGRRCAYCEGPLDSLGAHIEHFRRRRHFPQFTFAWANLYWSCDQHDSCGHYKDHGAGSYDVEDLIDPCVDDPDRFYRFRADGTITIRSGLQAKDRQMAEETLRVFNLDPQWGRLRRMRENCIKRYLFLADDTSQYTPADLEQLFSEVLAAAEAEPFFTAIRHVLTKV